MNTTTITDIVPERDSVVDFQLLESDCEEIFDLRLKKKEIEEKLSELEKNVKDTFTKADLMDAEIGRFLVHIKVTPETKIVDTAKLKADGLFEQYSKTRAGSQSLMLTEKNAAASSGKSKLWN